MNNRIIKISAIAAMAFSALHIFAALIIFAAPQRVIDLVLGYKIEAYIHISAAIYIYTAAFAFNILAAVLILNRQGIYAPVIISSVSAFLVFTVPNITSYIETIYVARIIGGVEELAAYSGLNSLNSMLFLITFIGFAICIPLSAVYAFIRKKENAPEYRPPVKGWTIAAVVILILFSLLALFIILAQKQLQILAASPEMIAEKQLKTIIGVPDRFANIGFRIPISLAVMLIASIAVVICCIKLIRGVSVSPINVFLITVIYPIVSYIAVFIQNISSAVEVIAYNSVLISFSNYISWLCRIGVLICTAAAAVRAAERNFNKKTDINIFDDNTKNQEVF